MPKFVTLANRIDVIDAVLKKLELSTLAQKKVIDLFLTNREVDFEEIKKLLDISIDLGISHAVDVDEETFRFLNKQIQENFTRACARLNSFIDGYVQVLANQGCTGD